MPPHKDLKYVYSLLFIYSLKGLNLMIDYLHKSQYTPRKNSNEMFIIFKRNKNMVYMYSIS